MKFWHILLVIIFCQHTNLYAQYGYQNGGQSSPMYGMFGYGVGSVPSSMMLGDAAVIQAQGQYLLNESQSNIYNQMAYSMQLENKILRTQTFFEMRQMNRFYRDLEDWQRQERTRLKRYGLYDREAIESIYAPSSVGMRAGANNIGPAF